MSFYQIFAEYHAHRIPRMSVGECQRRRSLRFVLSLFPDILAAPDVSTVLTIPQTHILKAQVTPLYLVQLYITVKKFLSLVNQTFFKRVLI